MDRDKKIKYWIDRLIIKNAGVHLFIFITICAIPLAGFEILLNGYYQLAFVSTVIIEALNPTK